MFKTSYRIALAAAFLAGMALAGAVPASASAIKTSDIPSPGVLRAANPPARRPDGVPGHYVLTKSFTPAQLYSWRFPTNSPGGFACTLSQVTLDTTNSPDPSRPPDPSSLPRPVVALHTTGANGNCAVIQSTQLFPTTSGVIEARIYLSPIPDQPTQIADWAAMWMYGPNWPTEGEIDAVESSYGSSAVTYHYGSGNPSSPAYNLQYTTYRPLYPVNGADVYAKPLSITGPNVKPGWNTVDIAFSKNKIQIYYNGRLYTTAEGSYITGKPAYLVFDDVSQTGENKLGIPGTVLVRYVRIYSLVSPPNHPAPPTPPATVNPRTPH